MTGSTGGRRGKAHGDDNVPFPLAITRGVLRRGENRSHAAPRPHKRIMSRGLSCKDTFGPCGRAGTPTCMSRRYARSWSHEISLAWVMCWVSLFFCFCLIR